MKSYLEFLKEEYAGQIKVSKDIEKRLKKEKSAKKSNDKKAESKRIHYYAKLMNKNKGLKESINLTDVSNNFKDLMFVADWDNQQKNIKVDSVTNYQYDDKGNLTLEVKLEPNKIISENIKIVIGEDVNKIWMYDSNSKLIGGDISLNTKTWLFNLKNHLPKK